MQARTDFGQAQVSLMDYAQEIALLANRVSDLVEAFLLIGQQLGEIHKQLVSIAKALEEAQRVVGAMSDRPPAPIYPYTAITG